MAATVFTAHIVDSYESQEVAVRKGWYTQDYVPGHPVTFVRACMCDAEIQFEVRNDIPNKPLSYDDLRDDLLFNLNVILNHVGYSSCQVGAVVLWEEER